MPQVATGTDRSGRKAAVRRISSRRKKPLGPRKDSCLSTRNPKRRHPCRIVSRRRRHRKQHTHICPSQPHMRETACPWPHTQQPGPSNKPRTRPWYRTTVWQRLCNARVGRTPGICPSHRHACSDRAPHIGRPLCRRRRRPWWGHRPARWWGSVYLRNRRRSGAGRRGPSNNRGWRRNNRCCCHIPGSAPRVRTPSDWPHGRYIGTPLCRSRSDRPRRSDGRPDIASPPGIPRSGFPWVNKTPGRAICNRRPCHIPRTPPLPPNKPTDLIVRCSQRWRHNGHTPHCCKPAYQPGTGHSCRTIQAHLPARRPAPCRGPAGGPPSRDQPPPARPRPYHLGMTGQAGYPSWWRHPQRRPGPSSRHHHPRPAAVSGARPRRPACHQAWVPIDTRGSRTHTLLCRYWARDRNSQDSAYSRRKWPGPPRQESTKCL